MNFRKLVSICIFSLFLSNAFVNAAGPKEATEAVRVESVTEKLKDAPEAVIMYVKGLCCSSCAIGIRKKVSKLTFVNKKTFNKGVHLDTKTQLVTIGVSENATINVKDLSQAIWDAGYTPVRIYKLNGEKLVTEEVEIKEV